MSKDQAAGWQSQCQCDELEPATVRDAAKLKQHIRCGFDRVRSAIDEELARDAPADDAGLLEHGIQKGNGRARPRMPK